MRRSELFWGGALLLIGLALFLGTVFHINVWPVAGALFLVGLGVWLVWSATARRTPGAGEAAAVPLEGAKRARVAVHHGAGRLTIGAGAAPDQLLSGTFVGGLAPRTRREEDLLDVELRSRPSGGPWVWGGAGIDWDLHLNSQVPLSLKLETGGNEAHVDLTDLLVTEVRLSTGASSTEVLLPARAGYTKVKAGAGVASVRFRVPEGVAVKFSFEGGLATANVDTARFPRVDGKHISPDYDTAANKVEIEVEAGVGSVELR